MTNNMQTPFFLIHKNTLDTQLDMLNKALGSHWPNSVVGYSYKTNTLPWVIDYANRQNLFAEVVSDDEYNLGKHIGVDPDRFIYNGPIKSKETFLEALESGSYVNIDAQREIDWLKELKRDRVYNLGIRVNFDLEACCPGHTQCPEEGGRFGFCYENGILAQAIREIQSLGIPVKGLHMHTSTKTRALDVYKVLARKACEIAEEYQLDLSFVDIGGGFFGGMPNKPQFDDYMREISNILQTSFRKEDVTLIVEPGMSLIGPSISFHTCVTDIKETTYGRFAVTDGSRTNIDPLMTKKSYFHHIEYSDSHRPVLESQSVCGYTCMEHDRLFLLKNAPELKVGDRIVYEKVGGYTMCLSPLFIKFFPAVWVEEDGNICQVRSHWEPQEFCGGSLWE